MKDDGGDTRVECSECGTELPDTEEREPCPECGSSKRTFRVTLTESVTVADRVRRSYGGHRAILTLVFTLASVAAVVTLMVASLRELTPLALSIGESLTDLPTLISIAATLSGVGLTIAVLLFAVPGLESVLVWLRRWLPSKTYRRAGQVEDQEKKFFDQVDRLFAEVVEES